MSTEHDSTDDSADASGGSSGGSSGDSTGSAAVETIEIDTADGTAEAFVARPQDGQAHAGVLFFMDAIGLRPQIAAMCRRIADWGFVVLAPNVFYRSGSIAEIAPDEDLRADGARERFFERIGPIMGGYTTDMAERDIPRYLATLRDLGGIEQQRFGTVGYCMGARLAVRAAGLDPEVVAAAGFHAGGLVGDEPDSPHRMLSSAKAEFVFGHADQDRSMPPEAVAALGEALERAGLTHRNEVYESAQHGYTMADTSMYHAEAAERHFSELHALFTRTLT